MKAIRIGNDIVVRWYIYKNGQPADLSSMGKQLSLILSCRGEAHKIDDYVIEGNCIVFKFYGRDQKKTGTYRLTYVENEGLAQMHTVDSCEAFILADSSQQVGGNCECSNVKVETVNMSSCLSAPSDGLSAYESWLRVIKPEPGKDSESDFVEWTKGEKFTDEVKGILAVAVPMVNVEYAELYSMALRGMLVPGRRYRIIDYVTTVGYFYPDRYGLSFPAHSLGMPFDIVVTAISPTKLSSDASALPREGYKGELDRYDLSAWKLKYDLWGHFHTQSWGDDNVSGEKNKGAIYYMKDQWDNEAPYDFYNIVIGDSDSGKHLFPWPYKGFSNNNVVRAQFFLHPGPGEIVHKLPDVTFSTDVQYIEVSKNSKGEWVAYNKADLFVPEPDDPDNPSYPYSTYFIGEL